MFHVKQGKLGTMNEERGTSEDFCSQNKNQPFRGSPQNRRFCGVVSS